MYVLYIHSLYNILVYIDSIIYDIRDCMLACTPIICLMTTVKLYYNLSCVKDGQFQMPKIIICKLNNWVKICNTLQRTVGGSFGTRS